VTAPADGEVTVVTDNALGEKAPLLARLLAPWARHAFADRLAVPGRAEGGPQGWNGGHGRVVTSMTSSRLARARFLGDLAANKGAAITGPMNAGEARSIAERWVAEEVARSPGEVLCVFTHGSINWMADAEPFPASSDLDLVVVVPKLDPARHRPCKRPYAGLAVEAFYVPREWLVSAEVVLADYRLAPNVVSGKVLFDPDRIVDGLRAAVAPEFARRPWVRLRCLSVRDQALSVIAAFEPSDSLIHVNGVTCLAVRAMAQMALLADLRNPTVKKALVKVRDVLAAYGLAEEHQELLRLLGFAELDDETILRASFHCRQTLDVACDWMRTPFMGDNCVTVHSRPSLDVDVPASVAEGTGREIFLWVESLYAHAMIAIVNDAPPAVMAATRQVYLGDMARIRSATPAEARARMLACRPALERMVGVCDDIVARNARALA
jgi:hypothetical protein